MFTMSAILFVIAALGGLTLAVVHTLRGQAHLALSLDAG